jgi:hypothetical protein
MIFHQLIAPLEETEKKKKKKKRLGNMLKLGSHFQSNNFILPMNENFINTLQIEMRISLTLFITRHEQYIFSHQEIHQNFHEKL